MTEAVRKLYGFELEPEVRDWLDSLSDSDYKRVDETSDAVKLSSSWRKFPCQAAVLVAGRFGKAVASS